MLVDIPFFTDELHPGEYARGRVLLRDLTPTHVEAIRRIKDAAIAAGAVLANGRPVSRDADAVRLVIELVAAAAAE